jgi:hypothetical protein
MFDSLQLGNLLGLAAKKPNHVGPRDHACAFGHKVAGSPAADFNR